MLPLPTPLTKGKEIEKDGRNVGGQWIEVAEDGSEDRTSTAAEKDTSTFPPAPTDKEASTTPPVPTAKKAGTAPPAPTGQEAGTTPEKPTDSKQRGTPITDQPATPSSESSSSNDDNAIEDEEFASCFLQLHCLHPDCKRMSDNETMMAAHHERQLGN